MIVVQNQIPIFYKELQNIIYVLLFLSKEIIEGVF